VSLVGPRLWPFAQIANPAEILANVLNRFYGIFPVYTRAYRAFTAGGTRGALSEKYSVAAPIF